LNSKFLALIWDYFVFLFLITLFIMAKAGFHLKLKLLLDHLFYAGAKRCNSFFPLEWEP
jgi:hypothetical protein